MTPGVLLPRHFVMGSVIEGDVTLRAVILHPSPIVPDMVNGPRTELRGHHLLHEMPHSKIPAWMLWDFARMGVFSLGLDEYAALVSSVTGEEYNSGILETIAERTITLERQFNALCGLSCDDDFLPDRFYNEPILVLGKEKRLNKTDFTSMRDEYYSSFGWDKDGIPTLSTLEKLSATQFVSPSTNSPLEERI